MIEIEFATTKAGLWIDTPYASHKRKPVSSTQRYPIDTAWDDRCSRIDRI